MTIKYRDKAYEDPIQRPRYTGVPERRYSADVELGLRMLYRDT